MTSATAVTVFTLELSRALLQLGHTAPPPAVVVVELADAPRDVTVRTRAFTAVDSNGTRYVAIMALSLWHAELLRDPQPWLRCMARHEAIHVSAGHRPHSISDAEAAEVVVGLVLARKWDEHDSTCDARAGARKR